jgi:hypothetical protein
MTPAHRQTDWAANATATILDDKEITGHRVK